MHFIWFSCVIITVSACAVAGRKINITASKLQGKIVGGEDAVITDYPYQVSLENQGRLECGGSILSEYVILTAAHCTYYLDTKDISVRAGTSYANKDGVTRKISIKIEHEKYDSNTVNYDVALIILNEPLEFSDAIQPIELPDETEYLGENAIGVITGWGLLTEGGEPATVLQKVKIPIVDQEKCIKAYVGGLDITPQMLCAGYLGIGGKDSCQLDSGGPLVSNGKQHGIVSWGNGCADPKYPGVYTRVTAIRDWIRLKVNL